MSHCWTRRAKCPPRREYPHRASLSAKTMLRRASRRAADAGASDKFLSVQALFNVAAEVDDRAWHCIDGASVYDGVRRPLNMSSRMHMRVWTVSEVKAGTLTQCLEQYLAQSLLDEPARRAHPVRRRGAVRAGRLRDHADVAHRGAGRGAQGHSALLLTRKSRPRGAGRPAADHGEVKALPRAFADNLAPVVTVLDTQLESSPVLYHLL